MTRFILTHLIMGVLDFSAEPNREDMEPQATVNDAQFMDTFLKLMFTKSVSNGVPIVIEQTLASHMREDFEADLIRQAKRQNYGLVERQYKRLAEAVEDYCRKGVGTNTLDSIGRLSVKHVVLTDKRHDELFEREDLDGWMEFHKVYPKSTGIVKLSRPGFSSDGTLAVIYMGHQSHPTAEYGRIFVLENKDGMWVEAPLSIGSGWVS